MSWWVRLLVAWSSVAGSGALGSGNEEEKRVKRERGEVGGEDGTKDREL